MDTEHRDGERRNRIDSENCGSGVKELVAVDRKKLELDILLILQEQSLQHKKEMSEKLKEFLSSEVCDDSEGIIPVRADSFCSQIRQMVESRSSERLDYYARRMLRSISEVRRSDYNDINLLKWREYDNIKTDSLWLFRKRGGGEGQDASYWGNFVPEIPRQLIERYTRKGEWVLDPFLGSGTTMVESMKMGRHCIGIDVNENAVSVVRKKIQSMQGYGGVKTRIMRADSRTISPEMLEDAAGTGSVQLALLHPPYHDIVKFSGLREDLSNAGTVEEFILMFRNVMSGVDSVLDKGRFLAIVIGDKYAGGELVPLSHMVSSVAAGMDYTFKGIVVKNFEKTRGKRGSEMLWKYRALAGGFYVFKHEYILIFRKKK